MVKKYSLQEVSELFHIPKSTLRYWEKEHLIASIRNDHNEYREYTTDDLIVLADILFYRNLNIPIKDLQHIYQNSIQENMDLLYHSYDEINQKIKALQLVQTKIQKRLKAGIVYENLIHDTPTFPQPYFERIVHLHMGTTENVVDYVNDQSILAAVFHPSDTKVDIFGTIADKQQTGDILWEKGEDVTYFPCYVKLCEGVIDQEVLQNSLQKIEALGYQAGNIIVNYLISDKTEDYYQAWIELLCI